MVKLKESISNVKKASLYKQQEEPLGSVVWFSGFGDYTNVFDIQGEYSSKHAIGNILDRKVSGITSTSASGEKYDGGLLAFDFDNPNMTINALGDEFDSQDEALLGSGINSSMPLNLEGTTIEGASGGLLFAKIDNQWQVIGILSGRATEPIKKHRDGDYGDISIFYKSVY